MWLEGIQVRKQLFPEHCADARAQMWRNCKGRKRIWITVSVPLANPAFFVMFAPDPPAQLPELLFFILKSPASVPDHQHY